MSDAYHEAVVTADASAGHDARNLLILYATETGNALDAAEQVAREGSRRRFSIRLASTDEYPPADLIHESLVVFVISTTGAGVEPRSMTALWTLLLRSDLPTDLFDSLEYAVFGLGDTAYEKFCWAAKKLARRLQSLGGQEIHPRGEGDEQHPLGTDGALEPWINNFFNALDGLYPLTEGAEAQPNVELPPPRISIQPFSAPITKTNPQLPDKPWVGLSDHINSTVLCNTRITASDWFQDVRHLELGLEEDLQYEPGDVAVIHPVAPLVDVGIFLTRMGWSEISDNLFTFFSVPGGLPVPAQIPRTTTLRSIFAHFLDIHAVPRRAFFLLLRFFAETELERDKLADFCTPEGADDLYEYCFRPRRTILEVLTEFSSVRIPREYIFDVFPPLRPRLFSIASSVKVFPRQVHLCYAVVEYRTKLKAPRHGVCTTYLASLSPGDILRIGLRKSLTALPTDPTVPIICVGPGTGIAPMRALLGSRFKAGAKDNTLYFGCRSAAHDHHYSSEWASAAAAGTLVYRVAFSRADENGDTPRVYVQDLVAADAERIWELLNGCGAYVFISGSANKMPAAVKGAIEDAARIQGGMDEYAALAYVRGLQIDGRIIEECWS